MLKMVDGTGIIGVDMICPLGVSTPQPPNYDKVELEGTGMLVLPNSLDAPLEGLELGGKTEQVQTTGKNVWDPNACADFGLNENSANSIRFENDVVTYISDKGSYNQIALRIPIGKLQIGDYKVSFGRVTCKRKDTSKTESGTLGAFAFYKDGVLVTRSVTFSVDDPNADYSMTCSGFSAGNNGLLELSVENPMISQISVGTYEPYTGGKPSPSPEYPQEIKNSGKRNEGTQKYEVEVTINSSNLFKVTEHTTGYYVDKDGKVKITKTLGYSWTAVVNNLHKQTVILHITTAINTRYRMYCTDLEDTILYKYEDSSANTNDNSHTFNMPDGAKKIYVSVLEINSAEQAEIALNLGNVTLPYEPYKEQTLTLTSDRPITKWDRLVEQGGQIGWLYGSVNETIDGKTGKWSIQPASKTFYRTDITFPIVVPFCIELLGYDYSMGGYKKDTGITINNLGILCITLPKEVELTLDAYKQYLADNPLHVLYKGDSEEFIPLPQSEQNAIRALKTYYPTTVITADGGELDPDIKATYRKEI